MIGTPAGVVHGQMSHMYILLLWDSRSRLAQIRSQQSITN